MQAVILAGGKGTRLRPLTLQVPKPLVPVAGRPYLEHQLLRLRQQQIRDVVILTGYLGHTIRETFGDGSRLEMSIRYSHEAAPLGTGGALREARDLLGDAFLVIYGDSYLPIDYTEVLTAFRNSNASGLVVAYDNREDTSVQNNLQLDEQGLVLRYEKQVGDPRLTHVEAGVLSFRKSILQMIPSGGIVSLENTIFPQLIAHRQLIAYRTSQRFYDIGTPDRLHKMELYFRDHNQNAPSH